MGLWDILTSGATGGLIGLAGSMISKVLSIWTAHQDIASKKLDQAHELEMAKLEQAGKKEIADSQKEQTQDTNAAQTLQKSYDQNFGEADKWVINIQSMIRPFLTVFFVMLSSLIYFTCPEVFKKEIIGSILDYTGLVVGWWFADRSLRKLVK